MGIDHIMKHTAPQCFIFIFALVVGFNCQAENAYLNDMRILLEGKLTRAEFLLKGPVTPKVKKLKNPERIVVDLPGTQFGKPLAVSIPSASIVNKVKGSKPGEGNLRFVFELKEPAQAKSFIGESDSSGQLKFIVDFLPLEIAENDTLIATPIANLPASKDKNKELDLKEQVRLLTQHFNSQQQKISALEAKVEQQGRLLAVNQKGTQILPPTGTLPMQKSSPPANTGEIKRKPPRKKGIETILREEHAIFEHGFTIEPGFSYTRTDRNKVALSGFLVLDAIALGTISVDEVETDVMLFDLTGRYGVTDRLQLDLNIPFLYRSTTYRETATDDEEVEKTVDLNFELSDISFGYSYQLFQESKDWPDIVWSTRVRAPTGSHPFGIKQIRVGESENVEVPQELPSGNGVWSLTSGLSFVKSLDPVVVFASLSYSYNFEADFDDISSKIDVRTPGTVDLGNAFQFGVGFALALNESLSMSISYSHRFSETAKTRTAGEDWSEIFGSDTNSAQINFGLVYSVTPNFSVIGSVAAGLTNDAPDTQFSLKFPYSF
jgi:hypothetical protein